MPSDFHEVRFPLDVALRGSGGPSRLTEIVTLASGREHRNSRWADSRRRYDAGFGIRTLDALHAVLGFFEERRGPALRLPLPRPGRLPLRPALAAGSRPPTSSSAPATARPRVFPLAKTYGTGPAPYRRTIAKPVAESVRVAVAASRCRPRQVACDAATGLVTFAADAVPGGGAARDGGLRLRRAGPLRHRRPHHRPLGLHGRGDPEGAARRDRAVARARSAAARRPGAGSRCGA